jgi:hypothetical protein
MSILPVEIQLLILEFFFESDTLLFTQLLRCQSVCGAWRNHLEMKSRSLVADRHPRYLKKGKLRKPGNLTHNTLALLTRSRPPCPVCKSPTHFWKEAFDFVCSKCRAPHHNGCKLPVRGPEPVEPCLENRQPSVSPASNSIRIQTNIGQSSFSNPLTQTAPVVFSSPPMWWSPHPISASHIFYNQIPRELYMSLFES